MSRLDYLGDPWGIENPDWQSWFGGGDCRHTDVGAGRGGRVGVFGDDIILRNIALISALKYWQKTVNSN